MKLKRTLMICFIILTFQLTSCGNQLNTEVSEQSVSETTETTETVKPVVNTEQSELSELEKQIEEFKNSTTSEKCKQLGVGCFNSCWLSDFLDYFGEDIFQKFMKFIDKQNIGDLHSDNIGYIGNRPVLIDYSGYWD